MIVSDKRWLLSVDRLKDLVEGKEECEVDNILLSDLARDIAFEEGYTGHWAGFSKEHPGHYDRIMKILNKAETIISTTSDAGAVRLFNDSFAVDIPNQYGDGYNSVFVGSEKQLKGVEHLMKNICSVRGKFYISGYDCEYEKKLEVDTKLAFVYAMEKIVVIVKYDSRY